MMAEQTDRAAEPDEEREYRLHEQVGFILRQVSQRHASIFSSLMVHDLTPTQFAAVATLYERETVSQNQLGRLTAMDAATIKGVVDRLAKRGITQLDPDPHDRRRLLVTLTDEGKRIAAEAIPRAHEITQQTLSPLAEEEQKLFLSLLKRMR